jgi:hypothetical protein
MVTEEHKSWKRKRALIFWEFLGLILAFLISRYAIYQSERYNGFFPLIHKAGSITSVWFGSPLVG